MVISGIVSLGAYIPLVIAWRRGWDPHRATWMIWVLVTGIISASMIAKGAYITAIVPVGYCIGSSVISVLSVKRGTGGFEKIEKICLGLAVVGMSLWITTGDPVKALLLNILADACAGLPTIIKLAKDPKSEDTLGWLTFFVGALLGIFASEVKTVETVGYLVFASTFTLMITLMTLLPRPLVRSDR